MVASANTHEIRYVRNPYFQEWSHAAQPDGNPDVIIMRFGLSPAEETRMVEQGKADWSADGVPGNLLPEIRRRFASQLHSLLSPETDWLQLNTTMPPFNDIRVRKALNLAIDRATIVRLDGGPLAATPTCQLLPPHLPGYARYCPYTRRPSADGRWQAPDLARARALVAASRTRGDPVSAYGSAGGGPLCTTVMRYTARVLRELGYRAQAHTVPPAKINQVDWNHVQIGCIGAFDPEPTDFFGIFACCSVSNNKWFCDRRLDADVLRARALEKTDPPAAHALLAKLDRLVTDRAIFLPLVNPHFYDFVSARLKNYVADPRFGLVVDQAALR
jgi:peptide/nickel transport system substrate-binding protein